MHLPLRRVVLVSVAAVVVAFGACTLLLPERFAVNAPLRQMLLGRGIDAPSLARIESRLRAAEGFEVKRFAEGLRSPRLLRFTSAGDLLVSLPRAGEVVLLERDRDGDGRTDGMRTLLAGLDRPHGLDFHEGWLYVAESGAVGRVRFDAARRSVEGSLERVVTGLPAGGNHWTRTLRFGPDGWMYVSVGSSCNVCLEQDPRRAALSRFRPDGSGAEIFATGLRNAVGFDWRPETDELYATDNGRDLLGDDFPPCELNRIVRGGFYGWPFANGDRVPDPDFGGGRAVEIERSIPPAHGFRAHNAPLGIVFLRGEALPGSHRGAALVALHGSWNRTRKDGYKVVSLHWTEHGSIEERDFLTGFEQDEDVIGRPVDVAEGPDGAIYVSDDYAGSIYRVSRVTAARGSAASSSGSEPDAAPGSAPKAGEAISSEERRARAERGLVLYEKLACAGCHEPSRAEAGVVVKPLENLAARYSPSEMEGFLAAPTPPMPAFPLSAAERRDLAAYLLTTHP